MISELQKMGVSEGYIEIKSKNVYFLVSRNFDQNEEKMESMDISKIDDKSMNSEVSDTS